MSSRFQDVPKIYDRQGREISPDDWSRLRKSDLVVAKTSVGDSSVSTVWLGLDHQWGDGLPLIFETLIFGGGMADACERYATETEAVAGHRRYVARVQAEHEAFITTCERSDVRAAVTLLASLVHDPDAPFHFGRYRRQIEATRS